MSQSILCAPEAEMYVKEMSEVNLEDVATKRWLINHQKLEKLTAQATLHVMAMEDEFIKEFFISYDKVTILVYNTLAMECWKRRIFTEILKKDNLHRVNFPLFTALQQELILCGLIDIVIYRADGCQSIEQTLPDLVDYCHRNITELIHKQPYDNCFDELDSKSKTVEELMKTCEMENLKKQSMRIDFRIGVKCISILCSIIDHLKELPFEIRHRLLCVHDTVLLMLHLMETQLWKGCNGDNTLEFNGQEWTVIDEKDQLKISKIEGQIWIAIYNLLMDSENMAKYEINNFRKAQIIKLRPHLTEILLDQIPALSHLRRYLEQLSLFNPPPAKKDLIFEQKALIFEGLQIKYDGQWESIANQQTKMLSDLSHEEIVEMGTILSEVYSSDVYMKL